MGANLGLEFDNVADIPDVIVNVHEKVARMERVYGKKTQYFIKALEEEWDNNYLKLYKTVGKDAFKVMYDNPSMYFLVGKKIDKFTNSYRKKGLTREDFVSIFWTTAWEITKSHSHKDKYFLYEKIPRGLESAGINFVKSQLNRDKRKGNYNTASYKDISSYRFEGDVEIKLLIEQTCTELEQGILLTRANYPNLSFREIGEMYGINHHEKVKRIFNKASEKMKEALEK